MSETVLLSIDEHVATISLNRPEKLNAFTDEMLQALIEAIDECDSNPVVRALVLTGNGRGFCAGGDVTAMGEDADNRPLTTKMHVNKAIQAFPKRLATFNKPIIAAVNGVAAGGGMDLALACDIRTAAESAQFGESYAKIGLLPGGGGAYYLPRIVGTARALELLLTAEFIDAQSALEIGLVNHVFSDATLLEDTQKIARKMAALPPYSIMNIKRTVYQGLQTDLFSALEIVGSHIAVAKASKDHVEAIAAFREKRPGKYKLE
ncbi:MAG: enoyl-CoA hydratase/isomerase family protein [Gammaproteobacteria bacterium]